MQYIIIIIIGCRIPIGTPRLDWTRVFTGLQAPENELAENATHSNTEWLGVASAGTQHRESAVEIRVHLVCHMPQRGNKNKKSALTVRI